MTPWLVASLLVLAPAQAAPSPAPAAESATLPPGCWHTLACYRLPSKAEAHPVIEQRKWAMVAAHVVVLQLWSGFFGLPLGDIVSLLVVHYLVIPGDTRPPLQGEVRTFLVVYTVLSLLHATVGLGIALAFALLLLPAFVVPLGVWGLIAILFHYWLQPVTMVQVYNSALLRRSRE